ncbi:PKD domain-containing protein [Candidatus Saccharibacteria bacterium]|nr:PKD domain-containing protein [Candidatus Saccharibacteria bacterium]
MRHWLTTHLKLSHHSHSGQIRPHEFTSYIPLLLLLVVVGLALGTYTATAATTSPGPEKGYIGLTGAVPGKPPASGAVILVPGSGARFSTSPITVSGTCPAGTLVEVFKNDIFAGSTPCDSDGTFSIEIDLLFGNNVLVARVYDALNQPGPDSNAVSVFYDALPGQGGALVPLDFGGAQLLLNTDAVFRGSFPGQEMTMPLEILGGSPPYAVNIQWGDTTNKLVPRNDNTPFQESHVYKKAGTYQITLQGTDAAGRVAFLTVAAIINGQPPVEQVAGVKETTNQLLLLWPLYVATVAVAIAFWLGEMREKQVLRKRGLLIYNDI